MEKVMYLLWKSDAESVADFKDKLLRQASKELLSNGAHKLRINVDDEAVSSAARLRILSSKPPINAMVSIWFDTANRRNPLEEVLEKAAARMAGYLVAESEPIVNTKYMVSEGTRTPGMAQVVLLQKPPRISREHWLEVWLGSHTDVAIETQSTFGYRQNVIVRALTYAAPPFDAIVEENFPEAAMTDPYAFYDCPGNKEELKLRGKRMTESVTRFIDFDKIDCIPTSEYVMKA